MQEETYSQKQVDLMFGATPSRTLRFWVERGLVELAGTFESGRGIHRLYSRESLVQLTVVEALMGLNFKFEKVEKLMRTHFHGRRPRGKITFAWSKSRLGLLAALTKEDPLASQEVLLTLNLDAFAGRVDLMVAKIA